MRLRVLLLRAALLGELLLVPLLLLLRAELLLLLLLRFLAASSSLPRASSSPPPPSSFVPARARCRASARASVRPWAPASVPACGGGGFGSTRGGGGGGSDGRGCSTAGSWLPQLRHHRVGLLRLPADAEEEHDEERDVHRDREQPGEARAGVALLEAPASGPSARGLRQQPHALHLAALQHVHHFQHRLVAHVLVGRDHHRLVGRAAPASRWIAATSSLRVTLALGRLALDAVAQQQRPVGADRRPPSAHRRVARSCRPRAARPARG